MREILFRGKRIDNGEWIEGCPLVDYVTKQYFIHTKENIGFEVDPETICQYTNLTDKSGRKIFGKDIVKLPKCENDTAVFSLIGCNYILKGKYSNYVLGSYESECFEVIGNIFDNPELLKGGTIK